MFSRQKEVPCGPLAQYNSRSRGRGGIIIVIIADICPEKREESISISSIIFAVWFHLFVGLVRFIKILSILLSIGQVELSDRGVNSLHTDTMLHKSPIENPDWSPRHSK